jgi:hypothetical protein
MSASSKWIGCVAGCLLLATAIGEIGSASEPAPPDDAEKLRVSRKQNGENLIALAAAMHGYHDDHQRLPPAAIDEKDGKPLLSWRVAILPYLGKGEHRDLYGSFKLDEPWDSPHNLKLLARMPAVYRPPRQGKQEADCTFYQVFVGNGTVFERGMEVTYSVGPGSISDGSVSTIMIVEAAQVVPWTKPHDLAYAENKPLPELGGLLSDGLFHFVTADGSLHLGVKRGANDEIFAKTLRRAITRNDGEILDLDGLKP